MCVCSILCYCKENNSKSYKPERQHKSIHLSEGTKLGVGKSGVQFLVSGLLLHFIQGLYHIK